jgi:ferredoxin
MKQASTARATTRKASPSMRRMKPMRPTNPNPNQDQGQGQGQDSFTVAFAASGRSIACPSGSTILAAARAAGLFLPSACNKGVCGTCKSRLVSGTVELRHGGGIRQREIDAGMTLLCCARPRSDLVVDR